MKGTNTKFTTLFYGVVNKSSLSSLITKGRFKQFTLTLVGFQYFLELFTVKDFFNERGLTEAKLNTNYTYIGDFLRTELSPFIVDKGAVVSPNSNFHQGQTMSEYILTKRIDFTSSDLLELPLSNLINDMVVFSATRNPEEPDGTYLFFITADSKMYFLRRKEYLDTNLQGNVRHTLVNNSLSDGDSFKVELYADANYANSLRVYGGEYLGDNEVVPEENIDPTTNKIFVEVKNQEQINKTKAKLGGNSDGIVSRAESIDNIYSLSQLLVLANNLLFDFSSVQDGDAVEIELRFLNKNINYNILDIVPVYLPDYDIRDGSNPIDFVVSGKRLVLDKSGNIIVVYTLNETNTLLKKQNLALTIKQLKKNQVEDKNKLEKLTASTDYKFNTSNKLIDDLTRRIQDLENLEPGDGGGEPGSGIPGVYLSGDKQGYLINFCNSSDDDIENYNNIYPNDFPTFYNSFEKYRLKTLNSVKKESTQTIDVSVLFTGEDYTFYTPAEFSTVIT